MGRQEFIDRLKAELNGSLASSTVAEHVRYYDDYIRAEMQAGKSEEAVLASLGDPRLIARTIIQTNTIEDGWQEGSHQGGTQRDYDQEGYQSRYGSGGFKQTMRQEQGQVSRQFRIPGWVWIVAVVLLFMLILSLIMSVLSFLVPVLIPVVVVVFLVKLFRDWLN